MKSYRIRSVAGVWLVIALTALTAAAQHTRTVSGTVLDARNNPVPGAIVYLKNVRTRAMRTYIADDHGRFVFHALAANTDYNLHAAFHGKAGSERMISSFDSRRRIHMDLKIPR